MGRFVPYDATDHTWPCTGPAAPTVYTRLWSLSRYIGMPVWRYAGHVRAWKRAVPAGVSEHGPWSSSRLQPIGQNPPDAHDSLMVGGNNSLMSV